MMRKLKSRVRRGGALAAVVLLVSVAVPLFSLRWVAQAHGERDRVDAQIDGLRHLLALLVDAETGQRGYVITGKPDFLQPYRQATHDIPASMVALRELYAGEPDEERRLIALLRTMPSTSSQSSTRRWRCASRKAWRLSSPSSAPAKASD